MPVHLVFVFQRGIRVWLGGLDIVGAKQSLSFSSLFHFFFPSSSSFQIRNVLWIVSCSSLGFDSSRPVVYRPHLGTVFVWVGVYQKEKKKNKKARTNAKGENITTTPNTSLLYKFLQLGCCCCCCCGSFQGAEERGGGGRHSGKRVITIGEVEGLPPFFDVVNIFDIVSRH